VIKYFKKSENYASPIEWDDFVKQYHGREGPLDIGIPAYTGMAQYFVRAGKELGYPIIDYNAPYHTGEALVLFLQTPVTLV